MAHSDGDRGRLVGLTAGRGWAFAVLAALVISHTACKRPESEEASPDQDSTPEKTAEVAAPVVKEPSIPSLSASTLSRLVNMTAMVQIPDQPERSGILLDGVPARSSGRNYLVICEAPAELESVCVAFQSSSKAATAFAKRISILPSGLSLYGFATESSLSGCHPATSNTGETYHAIRLKGEGSISSEEVTAMTAELETIRGRMSVLHKEEAEAFMAMRTRRMTPEDPRQMRPGQRQMRPDPGQMQANRWELEREVQQAREKTRNEMEKLTARQSEIRSRLEFPVASIAGVEVAAATGEDDFESTRGDLEHTVLATSSGTVTALRFQGKWLDLAEIFASSANQIEKVDLALSGGRDSVYLTCKLAPTLPTGENRYSMVAATTFGLESQGSGSIEQRLARVEPVPFHGSSANLSASHHMEWNGNKTQLWLKVFNDRRPDEPILDEVILIDYPESFSARWDKPPSPLIAIPESAPDSPEDLVSARHTLDGKGEILDIVAAGDGQVVMVRTDQPPFWAPLDMATGQWMTAPWKATADTLLAAQAGNIYLVDARTGIVEIWGLASGKREGMQLLPLETPLLAVAAPMSAPGQPLMVATHKGCYFVDPVKFEVLPNDLDMGIYFDEEAGKRRGQSPVVPESICLRASDDGSLYSFSGSSKPSSSSSRGNPITLCLTVDRSAMVVSKSTAQEVLASRGRFKSSGFPDHGGGVTRIVAVATNSRFPGPMGEIRFLNEAGRDPDAVMRNPPVLPTQRRSSGSSSLMPDRGAYYDSSSGVLLLPDGDQLHVLRINGPKQELPMPNFVFAGESLEIPLPPGSGHKLTSEDGGESEIGPVSIRWVAPVANDNDRQYNLKLEWAGELGSKIDKDYRVQVLQSARNPEALSADGRKHIPLRRRVILSEVDSDIVGFAGSGTVVLVNESGAFSAWNLFTGELILRKEVSSNRILGDADRIHVLDRNGRLTSYDILTGRELGHADLGTKIQSIATGMSSRSSLLAVEQEGVEGFLIQIPRDSLKPNIIDLPQETRRSLFIPQMRANASGSAIWSRQVAIFRDSRAITVTPIPYEMLNGMSDGVPDASGRVIVGQNEILNLAAKPPKSVEFATLPGMAESPNCKLDQSGHYLLFSDSTKDPVWRTASLRDVREPSRELLKIRFPSTGGRELPWLVSGTNTLIQFQRIGGNSTAIAYDFNIPGLIKELSR